MKVSFAEAFPSVASLTVVVEINGRGVRGLKETSRFDATTLREYVDCRDPRCYGGGFQIGAVLRPMVWRTKEHEDGSSMCQGSEGSSARKRGISCMTQFTYNIDIVYKVIPK
jgi:hypothetical protein